MSVQRNDDARIEIYVTMHDYLVRSIPEVRRLADNFYAEETNEQWDRMSQFIEGLQWMFEVRRLTADLREEQEYKAFGVSIEQLYRKIEDQVQQLLSALEAKDRSLLGDLLNYEIVPLLEQLKEQITDLVASEGQDA